MFLFTVAYTIISCKQVNIKVNVTPFVCNGLFIVFKIHRAWFIMLSIVNDSFHHRRDLRHGYDHSHKKASKQMINNVSFFICDPYVRIVENEFV